MIQNLDILSYNIHKGFSFFRREYTLEEIRRMLELVQPDIAFLQEVRGLCPKGKHANQFELLADELWPHSAYGKNAVFTSAHHGNALLSRIPMIEHENKNVTIHRMEKRGILYAQLSVAEGYRPFHVFCLHLNLLEKHRLKQVEMLRDWLNEKTGPEDAVLVAGDFNDWSGNIDRILSETLDSMTGPMPRLRTFPSFFPIFQLDRMFCRNLEVLSVRRLSVNPWTNLSDHLPLMARVAMGLRSL